MSATSRVFGSSELSGNIFEFLTLEDRLACHNTNKDLRDNAQVFAHPSRTVFAVSWTRNAILDFLPLEDLDRCKRVKRSWRRNITEFQRLGFSLLCTDEFASLTLGKEALRGAYIINRPFPTYRDFPAGAFFAIGLNAERLPVVHFRVECRAEGRLIGSKVVKKAVGSAELTSQGRIVYNMGVPHQGFPSCDVASVLPRLARGESVPYDGTLPHRADIIDGFIRSFFPLSFVTVEDGSSGRCGCLTRLIRRCFFSTVKYKISSGR